MTQGATPDRVSYDVSDDRSMNDVTSPDQQSTEKHTKYASTNSDETVTGPPQVCLYLWRSPDRHRYEHTCSSECRRLAQIYKYKNINQVSESALLGDTK